MRTGGKAAAALAAAIGLFLTFAPGATALSTVTTKGVEKGDVWVGEATCPKGKRVVSGGFQLPNRSSVPLNRRQGARTWGVIGQDTDGPLTVFAYCSSRLAPRIESGTGPISATSEEGRAVARCANGATAVAGGWEFEDELADNQTTFTSYGGGGRAWKVSVGSGDSAEVTAFAYCLRGDGLEARMKTGGRIAPEGNGQASARCRRGEELLGGGFKTTPRPDYSNNMGPDFFFHRTHRAGARGWLAAAHNYSSIAGRIKLSLICL